MESPKDVLALEPYMKEANHLVDAVINRALSIHEEHLNRENPRHGEMNRVQANDSITFDSQASLSKNWKTASDIEWLNAENFTIEAGERKINEFVETWNRDDSWLYCIDFLAQEEHECDQRYRYRVMWSIPTRRKPIPRATASVYFTIKISKFKPKVGATLAKGHSQLNAAFAKIIQLQENAISSIFPHLKECCILPLGLSILNGQKVELFKKA